MGRSLWSKLALIIGVVVASGGGLWFVSPKYHKVGEPVRVGDLEIKCERARYMAVRREDGSAIGDDLRLAVVFSVRNVGQSPIFCEPQFFARTAFANPLDVEPDSADAAGDGTRKPITPGGSVLAYAVVSAFLDQRETINVGGEFTVDRAGNRRSAWFAVPLMSTRDAIDEMRERRHSPAYPRQRLIAFGDN